MCSTTHRYLPMCSLDSMPPAGNAGPNAAACRCWCRQGESIVIVGMHLLGAARMTKKTVHRGNGFKSRASSTGMKHFGIVPVGAGEHYREWQPPAIDGEVELAPQLAPVGRIRAGALASRWGENGCVVHRHPEAVDQGVSLQMDQQCLLQLLPDSGRLPVAQPAPARHARAAAHHFWEMLPRDAGQCRPIRQPRPLTLRVRRMGGGQGAICAPRASYSKGVALGRGRLLRNCGCNCDYVQAVLFRCLRGSVTSRRSVRGYPRCQVTRVIRGPACYAGRVLWRCRCALSACIFSECLHGSGQALHQGNSSECWMKHSELWA